MKKICLFTLTLVSGWAAMAQSTMDPDKAHKPLRTEMSTATRFGLRASANLSSIELDDDYASTNYNTNSKTSFQVGAFVNIPLGSMFRIQPEVSYVGQGSKVEGTYISNPVTTGRYELDLHYIAVPVMFQLQTNSGFFVEAGPQGSFLLSAKQEPTTPAGAKTDLKDKKLIKKTDFAIAGGIGYLTRIGLGLNARYVHGISNIFDSEGSVAGQDDRDFGNRGVQLGLVYHFGAAK